MISENDSYRRSPSGEEAENTPPPRPPPLLPMPLPVTMSQPFASPDHPFPPHPPKLPPKPPGISSQNYVTLRRILQEIQSNPASIPNQRYHIEPISPKSPESKPKFATVGRSRSLRLTAPMDHLHQRQPTRYAPPAEPFHTYDRREDIGRKQLPSRANIMPNSKSMTFIDDDGGGAGPERKNRKRGGSGGGGTPTSLEGKCAVVGRCQTPFSDVDRDDDPTASPTTERTSLFGNRTSQMRAARGLALENRAEPLLQRRRRAIYRSRSQSPHNYLESASSSSNGNGKKKRLLVAEKIPVFDKREESCSVRFLGVGDESLSSAGETAESDDGLHEGDILLRRYNNVNDVNRNNGGGGGVSDDNTPTDESFTSSSRNPSSSDDEEDNSLEISGFSTDGKASSAGNSLRVSFSPNNNNDDVDKRCVTRSTPKTQSPVTTTTHNSSSFKSSRSNGSLRRYQSSSVQHSPVQQHSHSPSFTVIDLTNGDGDVIDEARSTPFTRIQSPQSNSKTISFV